VRPLVVTVSIRRGVSGFHIHAVVTLAVDETMGKGGVRREGYLRAPDPRGRTQGDRVKK